MKRIFFAAAAMFLSMSVGNSVKAEDIVILYTNDVHCGVEEGIGYAGLAAYKAAIEQLVITEDGNISSGVISHYPDADPEMQSFIDEIQMSYEEELKKEVAVSEIALSGYTEDGIRLVRTRETTIGNSCPDAYRVVAGADIGLVNGSGVRADLPR